MRVIMALVTGAMFMEILDGTIITTALPAMAESLGTTAIALNLGISAYLLSLGVFIPASGWVADRFGARTVFAAAIGIFTLASLLCGMTSDFNTFIALRIFQGMAGAMMVPVGRLVVLRFTPKKDLVGAISALVWPALIAPILGPPIGGFITTHWGWRWIFYINLPLGILAFIATVWLIPNIKSDTPRRFDWTGFVLCGSSSFALLYSLETLTTAIDTPGMVALLLGIVLLLLAVRHLKQTPHPLIDLAPARIATMRVALRGGSFYRTAISSAPFLLPLFFQLGLGYDAFHFRTVGPGVVCWQSGHEVHGHRGAQPVRASLGIDLERMAVCHIDCRVRGLDPRVAHRAHRDRADRRRHDALDAIHHPQHLGLFRYPQIANVRCQQLVQQCVATVQRPGHHLECAVCQSRSKPDRVGQSPRGNGIPIGLCDDGHVCVDRNAGCAAVTAGCSLSFAQKRQGLNVSAHNHTHASRPAPCLNEETT